MERPRSKEAFDYGNELAGIGRRAGGSGRTKIYDSRGTMSTGPVSRGLKMNRRGMIEPPPEVSPQPKPAGPKKIEKLESNERSFLNSLSDKDYTALQHKMLPRTDPNYSGPPRPKSKMELRTEARQKASEEADKARSHEFPRTGRDMTKAPTKSVRQLQADQYGHMWDRWKQDNPTRGFAKGGPVQQYRKGGMVQCRDYGK